MHKTCLSGLTNGKPPINRRGVLAEALKLQRSGDIHEETRMFMVGGAVAHRVFVRLMERMGGPVQPDFNDVDMKITAKVGAMR
jgi:hypothetical protein